MALRMPDSQPVALLEGLRRSGGESPEPQQCCDERGGDHRVDDEQKGEHGASAHFFGRERHAGATRGDIGERARSINCVAPLAHAANRLRPIHAKFMTMLKPVRGQDVKHRDRPGPFRGRERSGRGKWQVLFSPNLVSG